jgi:hypothetical protein
MGVGYNPRIVTDGLVLCLDAANKRSYPGSGTTWTDKVGGNDGTLTNSPTFNNNGSLSHFSLSGSNDNIKIAESSTLNFQPTQPFSVFCWFKKDAFGGSNVGAIIANMKSGSPYPGWDIWCQSSSLIAMHLITAWYTNAIKIQAYHDYSKISYAGFTYDGSCPVNSTESLNSVNFYRDGLLNTTNKALNNTDGFNSSSESISYPAGQQTAIGSRHNAEYTSSYVYSAHIYNRALSAKEVLQNYEATKGRYA